MINEKQFVQSMLYIIVRGKPAVLRVMGITSMSQPLKIAFLTGEVAKFENNFPNYILGGD